MVVYKNNPETVGVPWLGWLCSVVSASVSSSYVLMPYGKLTTRKFSHGNHLLTAIS